MKKLLIILLLRLLPITFAIGAIILAYSGIKGWGWFIVGSVLTLSTIEITSK